MKLYLDDIREAPDGWIRVRWPDETIKLLETGKVTHLSLDHDLGDDARGTGYDVVIWLEEKVIADGFIPPGTIEVHSGNPVAKERMEAGIANIKRNASEFRE